MKQQKTEASRRSYKKWGWIAFYMLIIYLAFALSIEYAKRHPIEDDFTAPVSAKP